MATETQRKRVGDRPQPARVEPRYKVNQQALEQLLTFDSDHPDYPFKQATFEVSYQQLVARPDDYQMRHSFAVALISDPQDRYKNLRFLLEKFISKGTEVTPEIQALKDDLAHRVQEALVKRGATKKQKRANAFQRHYA